MTKKEISVLIGYDIGRPYGFSPNAQPVWVGPDYEAEAIARWLRNTGIFPIHGKMVIQTWGGTLGKLRAWRHRVAEILATTPRPPDYYIKRNAGPLPTFSDVVFHAAERAETMAFNTTQLSPIGIYLEDAKQVMDLLLNKVDPIAPPDEEGAVEQDPSRYREEDLRVIWRLRQAAIDDAKTRGADASALLKLIDRLNSDLQQAPLGYWDRSFPKTPSLDSESLVDAIADSVSMLDPYIERQHSTPKLALAAVNDPTTREETIAPVGMMPDEIANEIGCHADTLESWATGKLSLPKRGWGEPYSWSEVEMLVDLFASTGRAPWKQNAADWKKRGINLRPNQ